MADRAIYLVYPTFKTMVDAGFAKHHALHIVVMDPAQLYEPKTFKKAILLEKSFGDPETWKQDYQAIARAKARQVRKFGIPNQIIVERMPHLLKDHDTRFYGSTIKDGIVVAVSGVEPWFDQLISEMVASMCQALCIDKMQKEVLEQTEGETMDGKPLPSVS